MLLRISLFSWLESFKQIFQYCKSSLEPFPVVWRRKDNLFCTCQNDQTGENSHIPRHVYANPICPEICPVLSMGLYLLVFPLDSLDLRVFPGQNQYERFRKRFDFTLKNKCSNELNMRGKKFTDYGSHSMRKGATSYCSNGTSQCPPIVAINLRGGRSMRTIQDTYMRYESAGDML